MATVEELRDALAQLTVTVQLMATNIPAAVAAAPPPPAAAAAPPVVLSVEQRINSSPGKLVQLPRQDSQCTDKEKGWAWNPNYDSTDPNSQQYDELTPDPTSQITSNLRVINSMPETDDAESQAKLDALINFHRQRGARLQEALRTLSDGGWVNRDAVPEDSRSNPGSWRETAPSPVWRNVFRGFAKVGMFQLSNRHGGTINLHVQRAVSPVQPSVR